MGSTDAYLLDPLSFLGRLGYLYSIRFYLFF